MFPFYPLLSFQSSSFYRSLLLTPLPLFRPCFHSFSIFLRLDAIELLRKYISSDSRSGGKRSDTVPTHWFDAIFTWNGVEEITVKARKFAFVEISRMPLLPLYFFSLLFLSASPHPISHIQGTTNSFSLFLSLSLDFPPNFRTNLYIFEYESSG